MKGFFFSSSMSWMFIFYMQEARVVDLGEPYYESRFSGAKQRLVQKQDSFQYVSLLDSLKALLCDDEIHSQVDTCNSRIHQDGRIEDFCDGELFKSHVLFSKDPKALQIIAYYDELEVCNPLGSHVKVHKLGLFYYMLGNIEPQYRSSLRCINLLAVTTSVMIEKYGLDEIMKPFIQDLNHLSSVGVTVEYDGIQETYYGALLAFLADNLGSHALGGFKESFSLTFRMCRTCLSTNTAFRTNFIENQFLMRTEQKHLHHCAKLGGPPPLRVHYSTAYGITRASSLLQIKYYSMFGGGLPHDVMHDLLEGTVQYVMKLILQYCVSQNFISLELFNQRLMKFEYGYGELSDKPTPITSRTFQSDSKNLHQSAAQSLLFARILPFLLADKVPEEDPHWENYVVLLRILDIAMAPMCTVDLCATMKVLIEEFLVVFTTLYPNSSIIPKMHYMVHYPSQIMAVGPLVRTWTMRYKAKNFKSASHIGNFKNIVLTLANHHQRWICYQQASGKLLDRPLTCGPGQNASPINAEPDTLQEALKAIIPEIDPENTVFVHLGLRKALLCTGVQTALF